MWGSVLYHHNTKGTSLVFHCLSHSGVDLQMSSVRLPVPGVAFQFLMIRDNLMTELNNALNVLTLSTAILHTLLDVFYRSVINISALEEIVQ